VTEKIPPKKAAVWLPRSENPAAKAAKEGRISHEKYWCTHGITRPKCLVCDGAKGFVYLTGGGTHFHATPKCRALAEGQEKVRQRGGNPEAIEAIHSASRDLERRDPCKICAPAIAQRRVAKKDKPVDTPPEPHDRPPTSSLARLKAEAKAKGISLQELVNRSKQT